MAENLRKLQITALLERTQDFWSLGHNGRFICFPEEVADSISQIQVQNVVYNNKYWFIGPKSRMNRSQTKCYLS
jgi:hypothetical protein